MSSTVRVNGDDMHYDEFIASVRDRAGFEQRQDAEDATFATLQTLGERVTSDEATSLAAQLPGELQEFVADRSGESFGPDYPVEDFYRRIADRRRAEVALEDVRRHTRAVIRTLEDAVSEGEFDDVVARLDDSYADLVS